MEGQSVNKSPAKLVLPIIVFSQFAGGSLWFVGNAVVGDLQQMLRLSERAVADISSSVQLGFMAGTLVFSLLSLADRFSPARLFLFSSVAGAFFNLILIWLGTDLFSVLLLRFLTGFFLAGIYPVGMKIAADWYDQGLGKALGYLVGALVLGKAFPHFVKDMTEGLPWQIVLISTSGLAVIGGLSLVLLVGDGPYRRQGARFNWLAIPEIFSSRDFRSAAFGYFGHMWELYTVWTFVPLLLRTYSEFSGTELTIPFWTFMIIGIGAVACVVGGYLSLRKGSAPVAFGMLLISGICCLISPLLFYLPVPLFLLVLFIWGFAVVGDSAQFSAIVAKTATPIYKGTALTVVNGIGFTITVFSIQFFTLLLEDWPVQYLFMILAIGPLLGLLFFKRLLGRL
jgi:predicted MFS family arabinose efflux permease